MFFIWSELFILQPALSVFVSPSQSLLTSLFVSHTHFLSYLLYLCVWFLLSVVDSHGSADGAVEQDHEVPC